jgi:protein-L-isoaspartate(D-aspartate) O-methyltransferase
VDAVAAAFEAVPRAGFLPKSARRRASYDGPISIGHGQTNSQPRTVENMLRLLDVRPGCRVLDVGSGSGWTTALLAHLTGPTGSVLGLEIIPALVTVGAANLAATGFDWAVIEQAQPDVLGRKDRGPFDRILVSAATATMPQDLVDQLADGGRLVVPVGGTMMLVVRTETDLATSEHGSYRFVPCTLRGPAPRRGHLVRSDRWRGPSRPRRLT